MTSSRSDEKKKAKAKETKADEKPEEWCARCPYRVQYEEFSYCPFVVGSCIKMPETIIEPDKDMRSIRDMREKYSEYRGKRKFWQL